jgi:hypothetical protein
MSRRQAIDLALDLARMPALARSSVAPPIPPDIIELMRIAAAHPQACDSAASRTGEAQQVLIDAARFYLQQALFRKEADCYRILGVEPSASRVTARSHMRWLLQWLHPDRNNNSWDAMYAERVLNAWHQVSSAAESGELSVPPRVRTKRLKRSRGEGGSTRLPWIEISRPRMSVHNGYRTFVMWVVPAGLIIVLLALSSAIYYFGPEQVTATALPR